MASVAPAVARNPKDSMKSTWRTADKSTWGPFHWIFELLSMHPTDIGKPIKVNQKDDPVPIITQLDSHKWVLAYALWPMVVQQAYIWITGENWSPYFAFFFYSLVYKLNAIGEFRMIRKNGHKYGFLDGDVHDRDQIPDHAVHKVFFSLQMTSLVRPAAAILLTYKRSEGPLSMSPWVILETGLYGIILDFYFYWYHRVMHETDFLWKYHRTHHLTKHPNPLMTLFADSEQEFFDVIGVPMMTWGTMRLMGLPMGFYDWWLCHQYIVFTELVGHSGLRVYANPPSSLGWLLNMFDANLCIEDHDLHHRKGWKNSANYGKQTRLWDKIFGTCAERIEMTTKNIDPNYRLKLDIIN